MKRYIQCDKIRRNFATSLSLPLFSLVIHVSLFLYLYPCLYSLLSFTSLSFSISIPASILSCHSRLSLSLFLSLPLFSLVIHDSLFLYLYPCLYSLVSLFSFFFIILSISLSFTSLSFPFSHLLSVSLSFLLKNLHRFVNCGRTRLPFALSHSLA